MKIKISLLSLYVTGLLPGTAVAPLLPYISMTFPEVGDDFSKIFLTLPSLIIVPFLLIAGPLSLIVNKRALIMVGLVLYVISGVGNLFSYSPMSLLFFRSLSGVAAGFIIPYSALLISDYFKGTARSNILSQTGIINNLAGIFVLLVSGLLITVFWRLGFLIYLVALVPFFLVKNNLKVNNSEKRKKKKYHIILYLRFKPIVIKLFLGYLAISTLVFIYFSNVPFIIIHNNLGGPIESSVAQSIYLLAGALSNIYMLAIKKYSINIVFIIKYVFIAAAFFTMTSFNISLFHIYIGSFILGLGNGGLSVVLILLITENTSKLNRVNALAILTSALYLGQFLSPFLYKFINVVLNIKSTTFDFLIPATVFSGLTIYFLKLFIKEKKLKRTKKA